jgi:hypothetical protein
MIGITNSCTHKVLPRRGIQSNNKKRTKPTKCASSQSVVGADEEYKGVTKHARSPHSVVKAKAAARRRNNRTSKQVTKRSHFGNKLLKQSLAEMNMSKR